MPLLTQDRQLLEGFRSGDRKALSEVYRHYSVLLTRQLFSGLSISASGQKLRAELGWCDIEVVLQETFLRAFSQKARESYDGLRPYSAFLVGVARNVLLDEYRRHQKTLARFVPFEGEEQTFALEPAKSQEELFKIEQEKALVGEFLTTCSEDEVLVYKARYEEGLSQEASATRYQKTRMKIRVIEQNLLKRLLSFAKKRGLL